MFTTIVDEAMSARVGNGVGTGTDRRPFVIGSLRCNFASWGDRQRPTSRMRHGNTPCCRGGAAAAMVVQWWCNGGTDSNVSLSGAGRRLAAVGTSSSTIVMD